MKNSFYFTATAVVFTILLLSVSSCSRCVKCTKGSSETSFCENSYSSQTAFEAEVTGLEAQGYVCTYN